MKPDRQLVMETWFSGLDAGERSPIEALFASTHTIRNAAAPPETGPRAIRALLEDFYERTSHRAFTVRGTASSSRRSFARWSARLTFATGAVVAGIEVETFAVDLVGLDVFTFDDDGLVSELDIIHQTTSVAIAAAANARGTR